MKNISLLSGGERALTATSLLFGLYLVKSSPYCILDEVDGPLDDANIGRFINLIRSFSEKTQFLIITHNKKTMAACDILYGVTLIEPGVSRTVSVSLANQEDEKKVDAIMNSGVVV
jgi:chromosome segregation protein